MQDPKMHLSEHFQCEELDSPDTGECKMDPDFMKALEFLRTRCGFVFITTSGFRTHEYNAEIGGAAHGFHPDGMAVDIDHTRWDGVMRHKFVAEATAMGFSVGIYQKHFHIDFRNAPAVLWIASTRV